MGKGWLPASKAYQAGPEVCKKLSMKFAEMAVLFAGEGGPQDT